MWRTFLNKFLVHLTSKSPESFFVMEHQTHKEAFAKYTQLGNVMSFVEWLEGKALEEESQSSIGAQQTAYFISMGVT